jgi:hypothetical protein
MTDRGPYSGRGSGNPGMGASTNELSQVSASMRAVTRPRSQVHVRRALRCTRAAPGSPASREAPTAPPGFAAQATVGHRRPARRPCGPRGRTTPPPRDTPSESAPRPVKDRAFVIGRR